MKFIKTSLVPSGYDAITIFPFVFIRPEWYFNNTLRNHECIHGEQYKELLVIGFLVLYPIFYIWGLIKYHNHTAAYKQIPFEQEAATYEKMLSYSNRRKIYNWRTFKV